MSVEVSFIRTSSSSNDILLHPPLPRRIPVHVRLCYYDAMNLSQNAVPKIVGAKFSVGGALKGEALFEMEDDLGRVRNKCTTSSRRREECGGYYLLSP